ncbi:MAG: hypothetical protein H6558_08410 [Lewinellaceae bacterium]|nr:hypothetical protein [Lewinellaceae bacterium]
MAFKQALRALAFRFACRRLPSWKSGELLPVTYFPGRPLQYRFDASRGIFNIRGETVLTKPRETFEVIPVAYRIFQDNILGVGMKRWAEFFFLNEERQLCNLLLHGYSVQNLMQVVADHMFYDNVKLTEVRLKITPVQKESKRTRTRARARRSLPRTTRRRRLKRCRRARLSMR